jgi:hypothetical protein
MAADQYFDAVGEVLSYVLSAEDFVVRQNSIDDGIYFVINRDGTNLEFYAESDKRYFTLIHRFSLTDRLIDTYGDDRKLLTDHIAEYEIDQNRIGDDKLHDIVAYERICDVDESRADKIAQNVSDYMIHSDCRLQNNYAFDPRDEDGDERRWNGVQVIGLLYPYEDGFGPKDYEQVAQEVISVGKQVDGEINKLEIMREASVE